MLFSDSSMNPAVFHCIQNGSCAVSITPRGHVIGNECLAEYLLHDLATLDQRLANADRHLRVVGVPNLFLGIGDQLVQSSGIEPE